MNLLIDNFAKIKHANIEFNGITVIAGDNNTGKSTIGKILFALFDAFNDITALYNFYAASEVDEASLHKA